MNLRSVAVSGVGFGAVALALSGFIAGAVVIKNLTVASATQINKSSVGKVSDGIVVEADLTTGITPADKIKKPGIPVDAPAWLRTFLETLAGRRGNKIEVPKFQTLEFSATPTKAECEALYAYANEIRTAVNDIIVRLDS
jgi:hypothetical protein